jgi:predicted small lipoprotein YifL
VRYTSAMLPRPKFPPKFLILIPLLVALLAAACGLKGPLYRADEPNNETVAPAEDPTAAGKKKPGEGSVQPPAVDPDRPAVPPGP